MSKLMEKQLLALSRCVHCNRRFGLREKEEAQVVKEENEMRLMHILCSQCSTSNLVLISYGKVLGLFAMSTDLTEQDIKKGSRQRITTDEVLKLSDVINKI